MKKVIASDAPLPELAAYLEPFGQHFVRSEGRRSMERCSTGLLSDLPRKNGQTIESHVPDTNYQRLQLIPGLDFWILYTTFYRCGRKKFGEFKKPRFAGRLNQIFA